MRCSEIDDCSITVHIYQPPRKAEFNVTAPPFIPSGLYPRLGPGCPPLPQSPLLVGENESDSRSPHSHSPSTPLHRHERACRIRVHRQCMVAHRCLHITTARSCTVPANRSNPHPPSGPGSTSASGLIDPCNVFCNNLDLDILSSPTFGASAR